MSTTETNTAEEKSEDKKEIEDEEREKMLNEENMRANTEEEQKSQEVVIKKEGEVEKMRKALEESEKESGRKKIPIGGIKMPGFLRSRSREKTKEGELDVEEGRDLLHEPPCVATSVNAGDGGADKEQTPTNKGHRLPTLVLPNPFAKKKEHGDGAGSDTGGSITGEEEHGRKSGILEAIRLPLVSVFPRSKLKSTKEHDRLVEELAGSGNVSFKESDCGITGLLVEEGAFAFRGIPYALPPVGKRRWKPAHPLNNLESCWNGTLQVHNATPTCWQLYPNQTLDGSEDCLTLDIFTPQLQYWNPLPVVVLIGAESLSGGSPGILRASAKLSREQEVVFVRPNFRLGVLGFLAAEAIKRDNHPPTSGNYGLSDIIEALNWIQLNIEHFGGDKNSVTVLGHRAGGTLVTALTASSGASIFPGKDLIESERDNSQYVESLSCGESIECLRNIDVEDLLHRVPSSWKQPLQDLPRTDDEGSSVKHQWLVLDGKYLQEHVSDAWKNNQVYTKIVMDIPMKLRDQVTNWTGEPMESHVKASVVGSKGLTEEALQRYGKDWPGLIAMISDIRTMCIRDSIRTVCPLRYLSQQGNTTIPFYLVNHTRDSSERGDKLADVSVDVEAILGLYNEENESDKRFVKAMQKLFYNFVKQGEVKDMDTFGSIQTLMIDEKVIKHNNFSNCDLWFGNDIVPRHGRID
ncbi:hypothetical protein C0J52_12388 [Blattella germanica]|nr:hypothetical protein C0J52_12388 [Blattella germanica]